MALEVTYAKNNSGEAHGAEILEIAPVWVEHTLTFAFRHHSVQAFYSVCVERTEEERL